MLLLGALERNWRVMIRGSDPDILRNLDESLWLRPDDSFLPHGMEGGPHDSTQPVLIGQGAAVNNAEAVMLLGGARVDMDEARRLERLWLLFEDGEAAQVNTARAEWRAVKAAEIKAEYWTDSSGRWVAVDV